MLKKILSTAIVAGVLAGLFVSVIHEFTTTPIILNAENFEGYGDGHHTQQRTKEQTLPKKTETTGETEQNEWEPQKGLERTFFTSITNILTGVGFAAILVACFTFSGEKLSGRRGIIWGLAGFAVFTLAPSLGLPPEVPGSIAADLALRQTWWIVTAIATGLGLWSMVFGGKLPFYGIGLLIIALPHIIGAPQASQIGGSAPPEIAGHFAAASIVVSAIFWVILGWISGTLWNYPEDTTEQHQS